MRLVSRASHSPTTARHSLSLLIVLCALLAACDPGTEPGADEVAQGERTPEIRRIFLISIDTLRADHLGAYGYVRDTSPRMDALAESGILFERAIAQWPKTGTSFVSMFSSRYPQTTGITHRAAVRPPEGVPFLPRLLKDRGFTTLGVVSNAVLGNHLGWDEGFDHYLQSWGDGTDIPETPEEFRPLLSARRINALTLPLLEANRDAERLFAWIHYSDPHAPYILPEGAENPFLGDVHDIQDERIELKGLRGRSIVGQDRLGYYVAQYDANILEVDRRVDDLLGHLESLDLLRDALVVLTADHGESLGEHDSFFEHGPLPYSPSTRVPLIVALWDHQGQQIGAAGRRVDRPVELLDLLPTFLELAAPGAEVEGMEGTSLVADLLTADGGEAPGPLAFTSAGRHKRRDHYRAVEDGEWKLVYHPAVVRPNGQPLSGERFELYRQTEDPNELRDLLAADGPEPHTEIIRRLRRELFGWMGEDHRVLQSGAPDEETDPETLKALRALGYIQ